MSDLNNIPLAERRFHLADLAQFERISWSEFWHEAPQYLRWRLTQTHGLRLRNKFHEVINLDTFCFSSRLIEIVDPETRKKYYLCPLRWLGFPNPKCLGCLPSSLEQAKFLERKYIEEYLNFKKREKQFEKIYHEYVMTVIEGEPSGLSTRSSADSPSSHDNKIGGKGCE